MTVEVSGVPTPEGDAPAVRRYGLGVLALALGMVLSLLDQVIVGTALPTIAGDLGGIKDVAWAVTAYLVTTSATTPLWGKCGDVYGRRVTYIASLSIFVAGSMLCGLSQTMNQFVGFRALQGVGAGGLMVGALALINDLVRTPAQRARLLGVVSGIMPAALALGPLLGGVLTQHASWRWAFYINVPTVLIALAATALGVPAGMRRSNRKIDLLGGGLLTGAVLTVALLASWAGTRYAWGSLQIIGLAVAAVAMMAALPYVERRAVEPILPARVFRSWDFKLSQVLSLLVGATMLAPMVYLPQYVQDVRDASPTMSGLLLLPFTVGMIGVGVVIVRSITRTNNARPYPIIGSALTAAGMLLLLTLNTHTNVILAAALTVFAGLGVGLIMQPTQLISFASVDPQDIGVASGLVNLSRTMGGSLGIAVFGSLYTTRLVDTLDDKLGRRTGQALAASNGQLSPAQLHQLPAPVLATFRTAVTNGLHTLLIGAAVAAATGFVLAWFVRGQLVIRSTVSRPSPSRWPEETAP